MDFKKLPILLSVYEPLIKPIIYKDELPIGYLKRLAYVNHYKSFRWLFNTNITKTYCVTPNFLTTLHCLQRSSWIKIDDDQLASQLSLYSPTYFISSLLRYCPLCLKEESYYRVVWQLKISFVCLKHKIWLLDTCSSCGQVVYCATTPFCQCKCGILLYEKPKLITANEEVQLIQNYLMKGVLPEQPDIQSLDLNFKQRMRFFLFMLSWLPSVQQEKAKDGSRLLSKLYKIYASIMELSTILVNGKVGFFHFLEKISTYEGNKQPLFTRFYQRFYSCFSDVKYLLFREVIVEYIKQTWKRQLTARNTYFSPETIKSHPWMPIKQACKEFNIPPYIIKGLINDGSIISITDRREQRTFILVYRPSIQLKINSLTNKLNFEDTKKALGITKRQLNQVIAANHFPWAIPPKQNHNQQWQFHHEMIQRYLQSFFRLQMVIEGDTVSITQAMRTIGSRIKNPLPKLLDRIRNKQMLVTVGNNQFDNIKALAISCEELNDWLAEYTEPEGYLTIPQLAKQLKINQEFAYQLINSGLIDNFSSENGKKRLIMEQALTEFMSKYVFLAQLSKATKIGSSTLINYFANREIFLVDYLWPTKLRLKVFYKEELKVLSILKGII